MKVLNLYQTKSLATKTIMETTEQDESITIKNQYIQNI